MLTKETSYLEEVAENFPLIRFSLDSLEPGPLSTARTFKFSCLDRGFLTYETKDLIEGKGYAWRDAAEDSKSFKGTFQMSKYGIWTKLPSKPLKRPVTDASGKLDFVPVLNDKGKQVYKDTVKLEGYHGVWRNKTLAAMISASVQVKHGTFKYSTPCNEDHFFAWRDVKDDEMTASGYVGVRKEDVAKLRDNGVAVYTGTSIKSCSNCSNCFSLYEDDTTQGIVPGLPSRPVSDLTDEGPYAPHMVCLAKLEALDVDIADYVNDLSRSDYSDYTNRYGYRELVGDYEVVVDKFQYGVAKSLVSQHWDDDTEEPVKEYVKEGYEHVERAKMSLNDLVAQRLESVADDCPMWTKSDRAYGFYESAKPEKCAVYAYRDGKWVFCTTNKEVKRAGRDNKFLIRCQGIELEYFKKSALERQRDFLDEFSTKAGAIDHEFIVKAVKRFEKESPDNSLKDEWVNALSDFIDVAWPMIDNEPDLQNRIAAVAARF